MGYDAPAPKKPNAPKAASIAGLNIVLSEQSEQFRASFFRALADRWCLNCGKDLQPAGKECACPSPWGHDERGV